MADNLDYKYEGNQLDAVGDMVTITTMESDFKDGSRFGNNEYLYDRKCNMVRDLNKKIKEIIYNYLNLPNNITFESGAK